MNYKSYKKIVEMRYESIGQKTYTIGAGSLATTLMQVNDRTISIVKGKWFIVPYKYFHGFGYKLMTELYLKKCEKLTIFFICAKQRLNLYY